MDLGADYNPESKRNPDRTHVTLDSILQKSKCRADWLWIANLRPNPDYLAADIVKVVQ